MGRECPVEKLFWQDDHDVVGDGQESHLTPTGVRGVRREGRTLMVFEHGGE